MSSTTSSPNTFLSSPRSQRMMMWIGGAILVIGIVVFLAVFFGRGSSQDVHSGNVSSIDRAAKINPITGEIDNKRVPPSPAARNVARTFLMTAVARKNLDVAWRITGPWLKGESRKEWLTGNNPVTPFRDATNLKTAPFKVLSSTKNALLLDVGPLVPAKITKTHTPLSFKLEVDRMHGKWLVNYFVADIPMQRLATPGAGLGGN